MTGHRTVRVELGERSYDVVVGHGLAHAVGAHLPAGARRAAIVTQAAIPFHVELEIESRTFHIGPDESAKSLSSIEELCTGFAEMGLTRQDVVVGVGGGVVTDVAGFAASCWHRGTPVVHVATTLLAMVDAAIGGKTGVNLPSGKNLVGAFWQPRAVVCDLDALSSLPADEMRSGLGEVAKYHFLTGDDLLALELAERIARCVQIKADVVSADEREGGRRAILNYGHTLGHALEATSRYTLAHGEAVAIGLCFAARLARRLGRIDDSRVALHDHVVGDVYGLACSLPGPYDADHLIELMRGDKKAVDGLTFVLDGPDGVDTVHDVDPQAVRDALAEMPTKA